MKHKIDHLLDSCQARNTLLAYYFIREEMGIGRKVALYYIMDYYFEHNIGKQKNQLCIGFGQQMKVIFQLNQLSNQLEVSIHKKETPIQQLNYPIASTDKVFEKCSKADFDKVLPCFYDEYIPYLLAVLEERPLPIMKHAS